MNRIMKRFHKVAARREPRPTAPSEILALRRAHLDIATVAQTSRSAVSQVSKPAGHGTREMPTWKSAAQQVWKPALLPKAGETLTRQGLRLITQVCLIVAMLVSMTAAFGQNGTVESMDYENLIFTAAPTEAPDTDLQQTGAIDFFSGNIGDATNTNAPAPNDGQHYLIQSALGAPIGGQVTFYLPDVAWQSPSSGSAFAAPTNLTFSAQAWQLDATEFVQRVDFYALGGNYLSNTWIGSATNSQAAGGTNGFTNYWATDTPGNYTISAVATDNLGQSNVSTEFISVQAVILVNGQYTNTHSFTFVQGATNVEVEMNPLPGGSVRYTLDGSDPFTNGQVYEAPITITQTVTVKACIADSQTFPIADVDSVSITIIPVYSVAASTAGGGSVSVSPGGPYASNTIVTFFATPSNGWSFLGWTGTILTNATNFTVPADGPISNVAVFGTTVTLNQEAFGTTLMSPLLTNYPYNSSILLTAIPNNNYYFQGWGGSAAFLGNISPAIFTVTNPNPVIEGFFDPADGSNTLTLKVGSGSGLVTAAPYATLYSNNAPITITALTNASQTFAGWGGATNGTLNPLPWIMRSNTTIIANFSSNSPPAVLITNPADQSSFDAAIPVPVGISATVSNGTITNVSLLVDGTVFASTNSPPYSFVWSNGTVGTHTLSATAAASTGLSAVSSGVAVTLTGATNPPLLFFTTNAYTVNEDSGTVTIYVTNAGDYGGRAQYSTTNGTAYSGYGGASDYTLTQGTLPLINGHSTGSFIVSITDNGFNLPNAPIYFQVGLSAPSSTNGTATLGAPSVATVTITRNEPNNPSEAYLTQTFPQIPPPADNGQLQIMLAPTNANGQWHFPWEYIWHTNGEIVTNLEPGDYPIVFRNVPNYVVYQFTNDVTVSNGLTVTNNQYYSLAGGGMIAYGSITVSNSPTNLGLGWRFFGETAWRPNGSTAGNLLPDNYDVEFQPTTNYLTPTSLDVTVPGGTNILIATNYLPAPNPPGSLPTNVDLSDLYSSPYKYCGRIQTEQGWGSGTMVRQNVVLTAAHVIFNDVTLSYVTNCYWYFQPESGANQPAPMIPHGCYMLNGYAAQRTNDIDIDGFGDGNPSPASSDLDVGALYFLSVPNNIGSCGYVCSDAQPDPFLTQQSDKILAGYPVDGSVWGQLVTPGLLYKEDFAGATFTQYYNHVYTVSSEFAYPGNSGSALFVQYLGTPQGDVGNYYPAAVYLGTITIAATQQPASMFRALDANAFSLLDYASKVADGTNFGGGGTTKFPPSTPPTGSIYAVQIEPPAALVAGGAWEFNGQDGADFSGTDTTYYQSVLSGQSYQVEFKQIPCWNLPTGVTAPNPSGPQPQEVQAWYTIALSWNLPSSGSFESFSFPAATQCAVPGTFTYSDQLGNTYIPEPGTYLSVGTYSLTATFTPNDVSFGGPPASITLPCQINPQPLTFAIPTLNVPYGQYSAASYPVSPATVLDSLGNSVPITYSISGTLTQINQANTGATFTITPSVGPNYSVAGITGTLMVVKAPLNVNVGDYYRYYGQPNPAFPTINLTGGRHCSISSATSASTLPGAYPFNATLSGTGSANYTPVVSGELGIIPAIASYSYSQGNNMITIQFNGASGQQFILQSSPTVNGPNWTTVATVTATATGLTTANATVSGTTEFFRVLPVLAN